MQNKPPDKLCVQQMVALKITKPIKVWLDNIEQKNRVVQYNIPQGWLKRYQHDERGLPIIKNDELVIEKLSGVVTVDWG